MHMYEFYLSLILYCLDKQSALLPSLFEKNVSSHNTQQYTQLNA
jgi:hypothetical protein